MRFCSASLSSYRVSVPSALWTRGSPNFTASKPEEGTRSERAVVREPGRVSEHGVGSTVHGGGGRWQPSGQSVPGSDDHRESHAPKGNSILSKKPLPWDGPGPLGRILGGQLCGVAQHFWV